MAAVLRCPYCGERIKEGDLFCSHCGREFDKPVVDEYATYHREVGGWLVTLFVFVVLWFVVGLIVGFITHILNLLPPYSPWLFIITTVLTVVIVVWWRLK